MTKQNNKEPKPSNDSVAKKGETQTQKAAADTARKDPPPKLKEDIEDPFENMPI